MHNVLITATALAEIEEICAYIRKDNPAAAASVSAAIQRTITGIAKRPNLSPIVHDRRVRAKLVERFQYRVFLRSGRLGRHRPKRPQHKTPAALGGLIFQSAGEIWL